MIMAKDLQPALETLEGIINSTVHPDIAVRALMVELKPIRKEITRLKLVMAHLSGVDCPPEQPLAVTRFENDIG